jgi:hypothetical protein
MTTTVLGIPDAKRCGDCERNAVVLYCENCGRNDVPAKLRARGLRGVVSRRLLVLEARLAQVIEIISLPDGGLQPGPGKSRGQMREMAKKLTTDLGYTEGELDQAIRDQTAAELNCSRNKDIERYDLFLRQATEQLKDIRIELSTTSS